MKAFRKLHVSRCRIYITGVVFVLLLMENVFQEICLKDDVGNSSVPFTGTITVTISACADRVILFRSKMFIILTPLSESKYTRMANIFSHKDETAIVDTREL